MYKFVLITLAFNIFHNLYKMPLLKTLMRNSNLNFIRKIEQSNREFFFTKTSLGVSETVNCLVISMWIILHDDKMCAFQKLQSIKKFKMLREEWRDGEGGWATRKKNTHIKKRTHLKQMSIMNVRYAFANFWFDSMFHSIHIQ